MSPIPAFSYRGELTRDTVARQRVALARSLLQTLTSATLPTSDSVMLSGMFSKRTHSSSYASGGKFAITSGGVGLACELPAEHMNGKVGSTLIDPFLKHCSKQTGQTWTKANVFQIKIDGKPRSQPAAEVMALPPRALIGKEDTTEIEFELCKTAVVEVRALRRNLLPFFRERSCADSALTESLRVSRVDGVCSPPGELRGLLL